MSEQQAMATMLPVGAFVIATLLMVVGMGAFVYRERLRRQARKEHPPIPRKLRRTPGHTLQIRIESQGEKFVDAVFWGIVGSAVCLSSVVTSFWKFGEHSLISGLLAVGLGPLFTSPKATFIVLMAVTMFVGGAALAFFSIRRAVRLIGNTRNLRLGLSGEQAVAEVLSDAVGFRAFHDIPNAPFGNIDHVTVGMQGVYAIETKTRTKKTAPAGKLDHVVEVVDTVLKFPWQDDPKAMAQAVANARWLEKELRDRTGGDISVQPLVVVPGWYIERKTRPTVPVLNDTNLGNFLKSQPQILTEAQVIQVSKILIDKVSDVDF